MKNRIIQHTSIEVAPINLGGNVFGWTLDKQQSHAILDMFVGSGFNFIDTADIYSWWVDGKNGGQSESIIGSWIKARKNRQNVVLATKVGGASGEHGVDVSRGYILKSIDASLKRLQTDYIDIYYTHFDDNVTPVEETMSVYDELIKSGKVRHIAASNITPNRLIESLKIAEEKGFSKYVALQPHYNLVERSGFEANYAELAKQYQLSVFPYWSLASGFLTGKYRSESDFSKSARGEGVKKYLNEKGLAVLGALDQISEKHNTQPATVALAWLLAQPTITAPIVSATSEHQLQVIIDTPQLVLDEMDLSLLNQVSF